MWETMFFKIVQSRYKRKFNFNIFPNRAQIFKFVKNFQICGIFENRRAMGSSPSGSPITQEECARVIKIFSILIQQYPQRNGRELEHV